MSLNISFEGPGIPRHRQRTGRLPFLCQLQVQMPHNKAGLQVGTDQCSLRSIPRSSSIFERIFLDRDMRRCSPCRCKGSCDPTADSFFVHAPNEEVHHETSAGSVARRTKRESKETQGWKKNFCATRHNGTTPKKSVAKLEPGLKTWLPKQNTKANNCKTVQKKKHENCRYTY